MEETWMDVVRKSGPLVTALLSVVISVSLATWISRSLTAQLEARIVHAESQTAQATDKLLLANQQLLEQLMRDQRVRNDNDAEQRAATESELRDMRAELKMLRQAVFTIRPAKRSRPH